MYIMFVKFLVLTDLPSFDTQELVPWSQHPKGYLAHESEMRKSEVEGGT